MTGTRVIYNASEREVTVKLNNNSPTPALIQSWIDEGNPKANPDTARAPFVLTPPIARVEGMKGQTLRIRYSGKETLPQNKESVFWLNVLEIPPSEDDGQNKLKIAFRSRVKLFYRPAGLPGTPVAASGKLEWRLAQQGNATVLDCYNASPYYVALNKVSLNDTMVSLSMDKNLVAPGQHLLLPIKNQKMTGSRVHYSAINDYGAVTGFESPLLRQ